MNVIAKDYFRFSKSIVVGTDIAAVEVYFLKAGLISEQFEGLLPADTGVLALIAKEAPMTVARQKADVLKTFRIFEFICFIPLIQEL